MTSAIISPLAVAEAMIVGPDSALKLEEFPEKLRHRLLFIVEQMSYEKKTPYEIAEVVVLSTIEECKELPNRKKVLGDFLGTPMVIEAFILTGMPSPYLREHMELDMEMEGPSMLPDWMDERLLCLVTYPATVGSNGPNWSEEDREQVHYVAQLLWNQDLAYAQKHGVWASKELNRLRQEYHARKGKSASIFETSHPKA